VICIIKNINKQCPLFFIIICRICSNPVFFLEGRAGHIYPYIVHRLHEDQSSGNRLTRRNPTSLVFFAIHLNRALILLPCPLGALLPQRRHAGTNSTIVYLGLFCGNFYLSRLDHGELFVLDRETKADSSLVVPVVNVQFPLRKHPRNRGTYWSRYQYMICLPDHCRTVRWGRYMGRPIFTETRGIVPTKIISNINFPS